MNRTALSGFFTSMLALMSMSGMALANFHVTNKSNEIIKIGLTYTFVDKDAFVTCMGFVELKPGETHEFQTGRFRAGTDNYWLFVDATGSRKFLDGANNDFEFMTTRSTKALFGKGLEINNHFVAREMARNNWRPLKPFHDDLREFPALHIVPAKTYNGFGVVVKKDLQFHYDVWN